jgi:hypothetical protein
LDPIVRYTPERITIHMVSPFRIMPELTTPATTAPMYGTEKVSLMRNSAESSMENLPWNGRISRNVLNRPIPCPVTLDTLKIGQTLTVVNLP